MKVQLLAFALHHIQRFMASVALHWLHVSVMLSKEKVPLDCVTLQMTALRSFETSATEHRSAWHNEQTQLNLQQRRCEKLACCETSEV
jgi:hypothetical protein